MVRSFAAESSVSNALEQSSLPNVAVGSKRMPSERSVLIHSRPGPEVTMTEGRLMTSRTHRMSRLWLGLFWLALGCPFAAAQNDALDALLTRAGKACPAGREAEAEKLYLSALSEAEKSGPENPRVATVLRNIAALYQMQGRAGESVALLKRVLEIDEKAFGPDAVRVALDLNNLATSFRPTQPAEAEKCPRDCGERPSSKGLGLPGHAAQQPGGTLLDPAPVL